MSARLPCFGIHEDCRVQSAHVVAVLDKHPPPELFDVVLELDAERSVVPKARKATVYFRAGKYEAAALAERNYFVHGNVRHRWAHFITVAFEAVKPGSPRMFVVTSFTDFAPVVSTKGTMTAAGSAFFCSAAFKESMPMSLMSCRSTGSWPICEVDGIKPMAIAVCRGAVPFRPTPGSMSPMFHVSVPSS